MGGTALCVEKLVNTSFMQLVDSITLTVDPTFTALCVNVCVDKVSETTVYACTHAIETADLQQRGFAEIFF